MILSLIVAFSITNSIKSSAAIRINESQTYLQACNTQPVEMDNFFNTAEAPKPNCLNTIKRGSFVQVKSSVQLQTLPMRRWKHIRGVEEIPILPYESSLRNQNQAIESISVVELAQNQRFGLCELDGRQSRFGLVEWTTESLEEFVC